MLVFLMAKVKFYFRREREEKARTFKERQKQARDLLEQKRKEAALAKKQKEKEVVLQLAYST